MVKDFSEKTKIREARVDDQSLFQDGIKELLWVEKDNGAFDGPLHDWNKYHKNIVQKYVKNFGSIVCAGGNCGMYPLLYSYMFKRVYTFEPDSLNFFCLVNNCQRENIFKFNCGLGLESKIVSMNRMHLNNVGMHTINEDGHEGIPMITLDSIKFENLGLIHLDVEGYEENIIAGAKETIKIHKPVLLVERAGGGELKRGIEELGYEFKEQSASDALFVYKNI